MTDFKSDVTSSDGLSNIPCKKLAFVPKLNLLTFFIIINFKSVFLKP